MSQPKSQQNTPHPGVSRSGTVSPQDDLPPGSDFPVRCSLQVDAVDAAAHTLDRAQAAMAEAVDALWHCLLQDQQPPILKPPLGGGEYVSTQTQQQPPRPPLTAHTRQQVTATIEAMQGLQRRLKHLLGIEKG